MGYRLHGEKNCWLLCPMYWINILNDHIIHTLHWLTGTLHPSSLKGFGHIMLKKIFLQPSKQKVFESGRKTKTPGSLKGIFIKNEKKQIKSALSSPIVCELTG